MSRIPPQAAESGAVGVPDDALEVSADAPEVPDDALEVPDDARVITLPTRVDRLRGNRSSSGSKVIPSADRSPVSWSKRPAWNQRRMFPPELEKAWSGFEDEFYWRDRLISSDLSVQPALINQHWLQLQQMLNSFLQMHFPTTHAQASLDFRNSYLQRLPHLNLAETPLLKHATAVVCTAHIANQNNDVRMQTVSHRQYASVINLLRREMTRARPTIPRWAMVFSIMLLTMFDDVLPYGNAPRTDWVTHYEGALAYLAAVGPTKFSLQQPETRQLIMNLCTPDLYIALARRKPCMFARPDWSEHLLEKTVLVPNSKRAVIRTFQIAIMQTPGILERLEKAIKSPVDSDALANIRDEIEELRSYIQKVNADREDLKIVHDNLVHLTEHEKFDPFIEEQVFMTTNTTFQSFFAPGSLMVQLQCTYVWMHDLILDCALLRIYEFCPELAMRDGHDVTIELHQNAFVQASNLCRTIYYFSCESQSQAYCAVSDFYLLLAQNYFENVAAVQELGWCQGARLAVSLHLRRLKASQPRTLCRMGDIVESVASVTAFRAPTQVRHFPFTN